MSDFLTNVARRGAGLAPPITPHLAPVPTWSPAASPIHSVRQESREESTFEPGLDDGTAHWSEAGIKTNFVPRLRTPMAPRLTSPSGPQRDGDAKIPDVVPPADPASNSGERSASLRPRGPIVNERTAAHVAAPAARADGTNAHAAPGATPTLHADPRALQPRANAVTIKPHVDSDSSAAWRRAVMTLPQAKPKNQPSASLEVRPTAAVREPPRIQVRIGKVEVRVSPPVVPPMRAARPKGSSGFSELRLARAHLDRNYR